MSTVILKWNPAISMGVEEFIFAIHFYNAGSDPEDDVPRLDNWSIWEHEKVHKGDTFYLVKLGYGASGIVAKGRITGEPKAGSDWRGVGHKTFYADLQTDVAVNPDTMPVLTSERLSKEIPDFNWFKGHSGMVLSDEDAMILEVCWHNYMEENDVLIKERTNHRDTHVFVR